MKRILICLDEYGDRQEKFFKTYFGQERQLMICCKEQIWL